MIGHFFLYKTILLTTYKYTICENSNSLNIIFYEIYWYEKGDNLLKINYVCSYLDKKEQ